MIAGNEGGYEISEGELMGMTSSSVDEQVSSDTAAVLHSSSDHVLSVEDEAITIEEK